jgi:hypothetical protein
MVVLAFGYVVFDINCITFVLFRHSQDLHMIWPLQSYKGYRFVITEKNITNSLKEATEYIYNVHLLFI